MIARITTCHPEISGRCTSADWRISLLDTEYLLTALFPFCGVSPPCNRGHTCKCSQIKFAPTIFLNLGAAD